MIKKKITSAFFSPLRDSLRYILVKCNGVMSREFAELWSVRASSRFLPCTGGFVLRFLLWKFSSAIYKGRFRNCSTGLYISPHEKKVKKKKRKKKSGKKTEKKCWSTVKLHGEKRLEITQRKIFSLQNKFYNSRRLVMLNCVIIALFAELSYNYLCVYNLT